MFNFLNNFPPSLENRNIEKKPGKIKKITPN